MICDGWQREASEERGHIRLVCGAGLGRAGEGEGNGLRWRETGAEAAEPVGGVLQEGLLLLLLRAGGGGGGIRRTELH